MPPTAAPAHGPAIRRLLDPGATAAGTPGPPAAVMAVTYAAGAAWDGTAPMRLSDRRGHRVPETRSAA